MTSSISKFCKRSLAAQLATMLLVSPPAAVAASTWWVNTCDDGNFGNPGAHVGTLRFAALMAGSGDTIDLTTQLSCSTISLKSGAIALAQDDITLKGPGVDALTITGKYGPDIEHDRIIRHSGTGWLKINDLTVSYGLLDENANLGDNDGGCIGSDGNVALNNVRATRCRTYSSNGHGGAVATYGALWLLNSSISDNIAGLYGSSAITGGGGAYVGGELLVINSTISNNVARAAGEGGGIYVLGDAAISYSTISGNSATNQGGGIVARANITIANSTLSGNYASDGGALEAYGNTDILSSTVVFNTSDGIGGILLRHYQAMTVALQSSLIANNTYVDSGVVKENDLDICCAAAQGTVTFSGAKNIVRAPAINLSPGIAATGVCPLLGALRNNGGPTPTHALLSKSPGIDEGDARTFMYDQRGFARESGLTADIGAYEIAQDDILFSNAFDGCP